MMKKHTFRDILYLLNKHIVSLIILILSLAFYILFNILYYDSPEWFKGASAWVDFIGALSLSYIAAYIFYLTTEFRKELSKLKESRVVSIKYHNELINVLVGLLSFVFEYRDGIPNSEKITSLIESKKANDKVAITLENNGRPVKADIYWYINDKFIKELDSVKNDLFVDGHLLEPKMLASIHSILNTRLREMFLFQNVRSAKIDWASPYFEDLLDRVHIQDSLMKKIYNYSSHKI